jgi:uncharacterized protein YjbJ (UPF0337 family)
MNWAEMQGNWGGIHSLIKTYWAKLTEEDLKRIDGRRDELAACLRRLYGFGEEEAEHAICAFEKEIRFPGAVK